MFSQEVSETVILKKKRNSVKRILRVLLRDPADDFHYIMRLGQGTLAIRKGSFHVVSIQPFQPADALQQMRMLADLQHPNIASIYDVYSHGEEQFLIMEHLSVRLSHLEVQEHELEEWEIATIISEVSVICYCYCPGLR